MSAASTENPVVSSIEGQRFLASVEAIVLSLDRPVPSVRIAEGLAAAGIGEASEESVERAIAELNEQYAQSGRSFRIEHVAGGHRLMTLPEHASVIAAFRQARASGRLSRAALETLSIIAYEQPMTRARLEAIRGVACGEILRSLIERKFITIKGRAEELGRPMLYGTTKQFLDAFGLASTKDLPSMDELRQGEWHGESA